MSQIKGLLSFVQWVALGLGCKGNIHTQDNLIQILHPPPPKKNPSPTGNTSFSEHLPHASLTPTFPLITKLNIIEM